MKDTQLNLAAIAALVTLVSACGSDSSSPNDDGGSGGSGTQTTTGNSTTGTATTGGGGSHAGTTTRSTSGGGSGGEGFSELGVCGVRSEGTVTEESFETYEEYYLLGDEGLGDEVCVVRFDVTRVGDGPGGCEEFAGQQESCLWTHLVKLGNPRVLVNEDSACEHSELAMTAAKMAELDGEERAYGYVFEYQGHDSVLMGYDEATEIWAPIVNAGWNDDNGAFQFDRRDGFCGY